MLKILGLGPGSLDYISYKAISELKSANENKIKIYLRTIKHPIVSDINNMGINYDGLDYFYEQEDNFNDVYENIANYIIQESKKEDIIYVVPGHPMVAEKSVELIIDKANYNNIDYEIIESMSFVDAMYRLSDFDPVNGFTLVDALSIEQSNIDIYNHYIITQVYDRFIASNLKIFLMEYYKDDKNIKIVKNAGIKDMEKVIDVKLYELDRVDEFDHLTSIYIEAQAEKTYESINDFIAVMKRLRGKDGCPWDQKQTHQSLKTHLLEEAYELYDAIEKEDIDEMIEELGDLLLHVVFHGLIASEDGYFNIKDIVKSISQKLIRRHPHVFLDEKFNEEEYDKRWEEIKRKEKKEETITEGIRRIPNAFPGLMKARKIQEKAKIVGFDWADIEDVYKKVEEEYKEVVDAHAKGDIQYIEEEVGDLLFAVVNLSRFLKVDPEEAINKTSKKFIDRFEYVEKQALKSNRQLNDCTLKEMDEFWEEAKKEEKTKKN